MDYRIEIFDTARRRIASFDETPLLQVTRRPPDQADEIRGLLPSDMADLGHAYKVRILIEEQFFCEGVIDWISPQWGDTRKLILDRYVTFHEVIEFKATATASDGNTWVSRAYTNREISTIAKDAINTASGAIHYLVDHNAYPDGAIREYDKFVARKTVDNELETGGINSGQWVANNRMDLTGAYAKDGDTISGLVVDGESWPDIRLMLIDTEETSLNSHTYKLHPETEGWSAERYAASGYKLKAEAAKAYLQHLIDTKGIDYIELNPHRDANGYFDDRADAYGRYIGLLYGGGECFNAALVEQDLAHVYLYNNGKYHVPDMALKDFFSYTGVCNDSVETTPASLAQFDVQGGILEILTALGYAAGSYTFTVDTNLRVSFRKAESVDRILFYDPVDMGVQLSSDSSELGNQIYITGNPLSGTLAKTYKRDESIDVYGLNRREFDYFSIVLEEDADKFAAGLLDDLAYPEPSGVVTFHHGNAEIAMGEIIELRDGPLRRLSQELPGEWNGHFTEKLVGRVNQIEHRISGKHVTTMVSLTSPLRSVSSPLGFIVRNQEGAAYLFAFRLDNPTVGIDMGFHLD
jgi:endonuclease YncB( thermonuclease family)